MFSRREIDSFELLIRALSLLGLWVLGGCDGLVTSACNIWEHPTCSSPPDMARASEADAFTPPQKMPLGPLRGIELRGSVYIQGIDEFTKLVGFDLSGTKRWAIFLNYDGAQALITADIDLLNSESRSRIKLGASCASCPPLPSAYSFANDSVYKSGSNFYYLQSASKHLFKLSFSWPFAEQVPQIALKSTTPFFRHAQLDLHAVPVQSTPPDHAVSVLSDSSQLTVKAGDAPTVLVVGDLERVDQMPSSNGYELIWLSLDTVSAVSHSLGGKDDSLRAALQSTLDRTSNSALGTITAAYISDFNQDGLLDFIYARKGTIFVTSYKGWSDASTPHAFEHWSQPLITIVDEQIKAITAIELTGDLFPELVVETDRRTYFYLNVP